MITPRIRVLSLGAGVQSTTMALMATAGEIGPKPDCAIFADTGWEPKVVYEHLSRLEKAVSFPVVRVSNGNILDHIRAQVNGLMRFASVPWFTEGGGMLRRQCTSEFKIVPIEKKVRDLLGVKPRQRAGRGVAEMWIGISTDEVVRMKHPRNVWQVNRWPLIEKRMNRHDCLLWLKKNGWAAPKSACIGCPYQSDERWREKRDHFPEEWEQVVEIDRLLRASGLPQGMNENVFMHRKRIPLKEAVTSNTGIESEDLFGNECEGLCGA